MRKYLYIALLCAPLPLTAQEDDRGFLEGLLEDSLSGAGRVVDIQGFEGALSSTATIDTLTIADDDGIWLTLSDVALNWNRAALLRGRLSVTELSAAQVVMPRAPIPAEGLPPAEATPLALPELPVSVNIAKLSIARAELGASLLGQEAVLSLTGSATLEDGSGTTDLSVTRLAPQPGEVSLKASYDNATQDLLVDLSLSEPEKGLVAGLLGLPGQPSIALRVQGAGPLSDYAADLALRSDGQDRLAGRITIARPQEATLFEVALGGDIAPLFAPDYRAFFGPQMDIRARGRLEPDGRTLLDLVSLQADALRVNGRMALSADGWPTLARLTADLSPRDGDRVLLPISGPQTRVSGATIALDYDAGTGEGWSLRADLTGLERPDLSLQTAGVSAQGTLRAGALEGAVELAVLGLAPQDPALARALGRDLRAATHFDWRPEAPLRLSTLTVAGGHFDLSGALEVAGVAGAVELKLSPDLRLSTPELARFADLAGQPVSGGADVRVRGSVLPISGGFDLDITGATRDLALQHPRLDPLIAGNGVVRLRAARTETGLEVQALHVESPAARITGQGRIGGSDLEGRVRAELKDIAVLLPELDGAASVQADITRAGPDWRYDLRASGPGRATAELVGTARGDSWDSMTVDGALNATLGALGSYAGVLGQPVEGALRLSVTGSGQPATQSFDADMSMTGEGLRSGFEQLDQILRGTVRASLSAARDSQGRLSLRQAQFTSPELTVSATAPDGETLRYDSRLRDLGLFAPGLSGPATAQGTARLEGESWRIAVDGNGPGNTSLTASGRVAQDGGRMDMTFQGSAPLALANDLIRPRSLGGILSYDLRVNGAPSLAALSGQLSTRDARVALPDLQIAVENLNTTVTLSGARAELSAQGDISSGGTVRLRGPIALSAPFSSDLSAELDGVVLRDSTLFETSVDGALALRGPLTGGAVIAGRLQLGQTDLRVPNPSGTSYADLPGLIHVNEPAQVRLTRDRAGMIAQATDTGPGGPAFGIDLTVVAPDRIFVRGRGLDAELGGSLKLGGTTQNVVPQGRFDLIRGRLDILGKRLSLDEGQIRLQGAFDPYLRFVASTETRDTTASIVIEGQASAPTLTFESSPELPQDEVLALILFGKDISSISPLQAVRLAAAINTLAGRGSGLGNSIREGLALDDLDVTTGEDGATEARAGKYLSENIYSEVTADTEGNSQINLNLNINRAVTARGRLSSDGETGIGLFIEKDY